MSPFLNVFLLIIQQFVNCAAEECSVLEDETLKGIYCKDGPTLTVDKYSETRPEVITRHRHIKAKIWFTFNETTYVAVTDLVKDFPRLVRGYPKIATEEDMLQPAKVMEAETLILASFGYYATEIATANMEDDIKRTYLTYRFIGFNQVFLGCPQPLCLGSGTDAAMSYMGMLYIFRGCYVWDLPASAIEPRTDYAQPITTLFVKLDVAHVDAATTTDNGEYMIFKERHVYTGKTYSENQTVSSSTLIQEYFNTAEGIEDIDAAFRYRNGVYLLKNKLYWKFVQKDLAILKGTSIRMLHKDFPYDPDAATFSDQVLYLIKGFYVYAARLEVLQRPDAVFVDFRPTILFRGFYYCSDSFYASIGLKDYASFERQLDVLAKAQSELIWLQFNETKFVARDAQEKSSSWLIVLIVVISLIMVFAIFAGVFVVVLVFRKRKRDKEVEKSEKETKTKSKEGEEEEPRFGRVLPTNSEEEF